MHELVLMLLIRIGIGKVSRIYGPWLTNV